MVSQAPVNRDEQQGVAGPEQHAQDEGGGARDAEQHPSTGRGDLQRRMSPGLGLCVFHGALLLYVQNV